MFACYLDAIFSLGKDRIFILTKCEFFEKQLLELNFELV